MKKTRKMGMLFLVCACMLLFGAVSVFAAAPQKISAPAKVKAVGVDYQTIKVSWNKVDNVSGYHVYRATTKNGKYQKCASIKGAAKTSVKIQKSLLRQNYYFKVQTFKGKEKSAFSQPVRAQAKETVPTLLSLKKTGSTAVTLTWTDVPGINTYAVFQKKGSGKYEKLKLTQGIENSCEIKNLAPNTTYRYLVRAIYRVGNKYYWGTASASKAVKTGKATPSTKYRALLVGNYDYAGTDKDLLAPKNDINVMQKILRGTQKNQYSVVKRSNQTKNQILELIKGTFRNATANDVSLFYYSGHGFDWAGANSGALITVDDEYLSMPELSRALGAIPGKVIIILDSCGSGAGVTGVEEYPQPKYGELRKDKFVVLTSCESEEYSAETRVPDEDTGEMYAVSYFTTLLAYSAGCDYPSGVYSGKMEGDTDGNQILTFGETYRFIRNNLDELNENDDQHPMIYPSENCTVPFLIRG